MISVVVPSVGRPDSLARALVAVRKSSFRDYEIVVVARIDDPDTIAVAEKYNARCVLVSKPGLAHAMAEGAKHALGSAVAYTDDDAEPHVNWLAKLNAMYEDDPSVVGCGGPDVVHDEGVARVVQSAGPSTVGRLTRSGRVLGNHHRAAGGKFEVDHLKGVNCSFRRELIVSAKHETLIHGSGAQSRGEFVLSLAVSAHGGRLVFDSSCVVDHFPAQRLAGDERLKSASKAYEAAYNEHIGVLEFKPGLRWRNLVYLSVWGYPHAPGLFRFMRGSHTSSIFNVLSALYAAECGHRGRHRGATC